MRPLIADLFSGAGGAAMGLHRAGFDVVGFDNKPQKLYPFPFVLQDALTVDLSGFDAVWASPPCQRWVDPNSGHDRGYPDLIAPLRPLLGDKPYIIENVEKAPLRATLRLCGTQFGLRVIRHRIFETNCRIEPLLLPCNHWGRVSEGTFAAAYARGGKGPRHGAGVREPRPTSPGPDIGESMGIDWMDEYGLTQAVPPAYSEYLGKQLIEML